MQARQDAGHTAEAIDDGARKRPVFRALGYGHYARIEPEFVGNVKLITGGTSGVGAATAQRQRP